MKISYSSFDTFNRCPLQYKFSYIDRIKTPDRPELMFGGLIHEIVQFALRRDPVIPEYAELTAMLKNRWPKQVFNTEAENDQYLKLGEKMLREFYDNFKPGLRNIVSTEKRFSIPLNDKHTLSGIIDRVDQLPIGSYEIIDYKTSKTLPTQPEIDKDKQLCVYNLAVKSLWPDVKDVRLTLYYLKFNTQLSTKRQDYEVEEIKEELIKTADKIENEKEFKPKKNPLCDWCDFQNRCPAYKETKVSNVKEDEIISKFLTAKKTVDVLELEIHKIMDKNKKDVLKHKNIRVYRDSDKKLSIRD